MQNLAIEPALAPTLVRLAVRAQHDERAAAVCATADELAALNPHLDLCLGLAAQCRGRRPTSTSPNPHPPHVEAAGDTCIRSRMRRPQEAFGRQLRPRR